MKYEINYSQSECKDIRFKINLLCGIVFGFLSKRIKKLKPQETIYVDDVLIGLSSSNKKTLNYDKLLLLFLFFLEEIVLKSDFSSPT